MGIVSIIAKMLLPTIDVGGLASGAVKKLLGNALAAHFVHIQANGKTVPANVSAHLQADGVSWTNPGADESANQHANEPAGERITRVALYWLVKSFGVKVGMVVDGIRDYFDAPVYAAAVTLGLVAGMSIDQVCAITAQALVTVILAEISGPIDQGVSDLINLIGLGGVPAVSSSAAVNAASPAPSAPSQSDAVAALNTLAAHVGAVNTQEEAKPIS